jgi:histidine triad (HIT) family protein
MNDCIFCKIVKKEIPSSVVYENEDCLAVLDIMPANLGHVLVLTKRHYETVLDIPPHEFSSLLEIVLAVARGVKKAFNLEGFNLLQNNGKVAGQLIPHFHFHIIPRKENDGVILKWEHLKYGTEEEKTEVLNLIKNNIS